MISKTTDISWREGLLCGLGLALTVLAAAKGRSVRKGVTRVADAFLRVQEGSSMWGADPRAVFRLQGRVHRLERRTGNLTVRMMLRRYQEASASAASTTGPLEAEFVRLRRQLGRCQNEIRTRLDCNQAMLEDRRFRSGDADSFSLSPYQNDVSTLVELQQRIERLSDWIVSGVERFMSLSDSFVRRS